MNTGEMIDVLMAHGEGKQIQIGTEGNTSNGWVDVENPSWNFRDNAYRTKPEPREFYINIYSDNYNCVHPSLDSAKNGSRCSSGLVETIKVTEVIE